MKDAKSACPFLTKMDSTVKEASQADIIEMGVDLKGEIKEQEGMYTFVSVPNTFINHFIML